MSAVGRLDRGGVANRRERGDSKLKDPPLALSLAASGTGKGTKASRAIIVIIIIIYNNHNYVCKPVGRAGSQPASQPASQLLPLGWSPVARSLVLLASPATRSH